jgi:chemotaxis-related protein WspB
MLFLLFELGEDRYALDARRIAEVLPLVRIKRIPRAPEGVAGVIDYHGSPVPVIDLSLLALGRPARQRLSTRIVVVRYPDGGDHLLGLIAERASETLRREPSDFSDSGVTSEAAPYLGPVTRDGRGLVQRVEVERLLPAAVRERLFRPEALP